jgi:ABC-type multidrug transport system fused ATPase/permease subunit
LPNHLLAVATVSSLLTLMASFALAVTPIACLALVPAAVFYARLAVRFCAGKRELQSLATASESPLLSSFQESLDESGVFVVRAAGQEAAQVEKYMENLDAHTRVFALVENTANRYLDVRAAFAGAVTVAGVGGCAVASAGRLSPGLVGLTLLWSFKMTLPLTWLPYDGTAGHSDQPPARPLFARLTLGFVCSFIFGIVEAGLVSVARIRGFLFSLPREGGEVEEGDNELARSGWPANGQVEVRAACMRYQPQFPLALRGLSLSVPAGRRLGVCGRTGAGKSSIIAALTRSTELESGAILLDGVDIRSVGLGLVRQKVCVLPQAPMLFRGSVRENVDPTSICSDAEVWTALRHAQATRCVETLGGGLDGSIDDNGSNISPGERQLVALARVLCRHRSSNKFSVLILDEASSQLDKGTDEKVQRAIDEWLTGVTIIIVAHRIDTVLGCDHVCVVDKGLIAEGPAPPHVLLASEGSKFSRLAREMGIVATR